jgi:putative transposase
MGNLGSIMKQPKTYYTAKELAGRPGLPSTEQAVNYRARKENWPFQKRSGRGGGKEYPLTALPAETRDYLLDQLITKLPEKVCALPAVAHETAVAVVEAPAFPAVTTLKKWQRDTMDARIYFMRLIEEAAAKGLGVTNAIRTLVAKAHGGELPPEAQAMVPLANKRSGIDTKKRALSERSLMRWWSEWNKGGKQASALAPKAVEKEDLPLWAPYFLQVYRVPQKISVAHALEDLAAILPPAIELPSEHQARRFITKYSKLDIQRGRMTGKELKSLKGFIRRDTSMFQPLDICLCDGHSFKAKVAHPVHGRPFKPEVCAVIDAVTKVVLGWSTGLAESSQTVADAYRHAVTVNDGKRYGGIPAFLYADKGAGNEAGVNSDPFCGMYARVGSTYKTGIPGNSHARGLIERAQGSLWVRAAKKLITYTGNGMDEQVQRKIYLAMESDVKKALKAGKEGKKSELLMSWQEFLDFAANEVAEYNMRPHSALPRITDPESGLRRNMRPLEMWAKWISEGWTPNLPEPTEIEGLFRPHVTVTTRRGEVRLFGNIYYAAELVHYGGQTVIVAYDIHDASQVWVKDAEERLICLARFEANKRAFYPVSAVEQAREDRRKRRAKTLERHLDEVNAEARPAIEAVPSVMELPVEVIAFEERKKEEEKKKEVSRAYFDNVADLYDDIRQREKRGNASQYEMTWAEDYDRSLGSGKRLGFYKTDPNCAGRFNAEAAQAQ